MRIAIIDLGTNTFNLLISDRLENGQYNTVFKTKIPVKLGQGGIDKGIISSDAFERGIKALKEHQQSINEYQTHKYRAFATSAIRSTKNGHEFVKEAKQSLGIDIEVIDGNKEAELIYYGVREVIKFESSYDLIMDIGGGSTEFIIANSNGVAWAKSYPLGVSRLKELFKPSDPISKPDINGIIQFIDESLVDLFEALSKSPCLRLVGSSGSFDSIVEMIAHQFQDPERVRQKSAVIHSEEFAWLYDYLIDSDIDKRLNTPGLVPMRADMIVISVIFIHYILKKTDIYSIKRSKYALKEGALRQFFK